MGQHQDRTNALANVANKIAPAVSSCFNPSPPTYRTIACYPPGVYMDPKPIKQVEYSF